MLGVRTHTVTRTAADSYVDGDIVRGAESTFDIRGTILPLSARERLLLPENVRSQQLAKLITKTQLQVANRTLRLSADKVTANTGLTYHIIGDEDFSHGGLAHYQYILALEDNS